MLSLFKNQRVLITTLLFFALGYCFFIWDIQFPKTHNFDEFHYVPSAKQVLEFKKNQNWEHPPLGKELMAVGIGLWGDNPMGWRFMSVIFGALTLSGAYVLGLVLFESHLIAVWATLLTLGNSLLYVQARIGMLDTFMMGFLIWAIAAFVWCWNPNRTSKELLSSLSLSGVLFGLSTATKWFSVIPWLCCFLAVLILKLLHYWNIKFETLPHSHLSPDSEWYHPKLFKSVSIFQIALAFFGLGIFLYFLTFLPIMAAQDAGFGLKDLLAKQSEMFNGQLRVVTDHPYMSHWLGWPFLARPIWYAYAADTDAKELVRGVVLLGNPLIMWGGLLALLVSFYQWITTRSKVSFLVLFFYGALYFCWAVIPRKIAFYYYYYPAGMILSYVWANVMFTNYRTHSDSIRAFFTRKYWAQTTFLLLSLGVFFYFFPILAGDLRPSQDFRRWMWFAKWI